MRAEILLQSLYEQIKNGVEITETDLDAAIRMMPPVNDKKPKNRHGIEAADTDVYIRTMRKTITPYSHVQANYIRALYDNELVFALGPAGTGKTLLRWRWRCTCSSTKRWSALSSAALRWKRVKSWGFYLGT